jgi:hypothetical protein
MVRRARFVRGTTGKEMDGDERMNARSAISCKFCSRTKIVGTTWQMICFTIGSGHRPSQA